jgi:hypothetical protein
MGWPPAKFWDQRSMALAVLSAYNTPVNWVQVLYAPRCSFCGLPKRKGAWGTGFCPVCEGNLPDRVSWHLRTAFGNRWFMRWWKLAMTLRRRYSANG